MLNYGDIVIYLYNVFDCGSCPILPSYIQIKIRTPFFLKGFSPTNGFPMGIGLPNLEIELNVRSHRSLGVREGGVELLAARGYRRGRGTRDHCCHPSRATSDWSTAQTCDYEGQLHRQSSQ